MRSTVAPAPGDLGVRTAAARRWRWLPAFVWVVVSYLVFTANDHLVRGGDPVPSALIPVVLILDGTVLLDRFAATEHIREARPYWVTETRAGTASSYPIATGIVALPIFAPSILYHEWWDPLSTEAWRDLAVGPLQKVAAALLAALSVGLFWLVARALGFSIPLAGMLTALYAFGSETMVISSQALWQHGPGSLTLLGAVACLLGLERRPRQAAALLGLCLGLMIAIRPTNLLLAAPLLALALWRAPRLMPLVIGLTALTLAPFVAYNLWVFSSPFGGYGGAVAQLELENLGAGLAGVLFSPGRGLLLYFPASLLALVLLARHPALWRNGLVQALVVGVVLLVGVIASWPMWWGGHCFGPRLLTEAQGPILLLLGLAFPTRPIPRRGAVVALVVILALSVVIQATGVYSPATAGWNVTPANVDQEHSRLWDFADNPVARGLLSRTDR